MGTEGLPPRVLRELFRVAVRPLLIIFESLWRLGGVPDKWEKANVTSVFKKEDLGIYKPVNLT